MPHYIWEGLFSVLNVLVPGVVLALFAAYYQNRRKREIKIEGKLAIDRINSYEKILACFYEGQNLNDATLEEEQSAESILGYFDVDTFHCEYPYAFKDEEVFEAFYKRLIELQREYQIYLDEEVSRQLDKSVGVYTRLKQWMDAFCDTEHVVDLKVKKEVAKEHIDWMYKLTGMMMFSHCTRAFAQLDQIVCKQINRFSLTYRKHRLRQWVREIGESILFRIDMCSRKKGLAGVFCEWLLLLSLDKEDKDMMRIMETVVEVMRYVHFSDRYSPQEFFEGIKGPGEEEMALYGKVFMAMVHRS